jgi:DNA-binding SARP family transcriptional activator
LRLVTLGGLAVIDADGRALELRHKLLTLLAVVGVGRRVSRERLTALFWPDSGSEDARHSLAQAVYSLRRHLGRDVFVNGRANQLELDAAVISCDARELEQAVGRSDAERAAELYAGPLLDGDAPGDSVELEHWVEMERARLRRVATEALEASSRNRERAGDHRGAARCWQRLVTLDPLSGRYAAAYMRALSRAGDRGAAVAHFRTHEAAVRRELEAAPDAEVVRLVQELRAESWSPAPRPAPDPAVRWPRLRARRPFSSLLGYPPNRAPDHVPKHQGPRQLRAARYR